MEERLALRATGRGKAHRRYTFLPIHSQHVPALISHAPRPFPFARGCPFQRGKSLKPIRNSSTERAT